MIDKTKVLGLNYFAITDLGYLTSVLKGYSYGKSENVKIIAGVELFFKDDECDIIRGTESEQIKYFKIIVHAKDQEAYQKIVRMCSDTRRKQITVSGNSYGTFNWADLAELAKSNITIATSNIECMVSKHLLVNRADLGLKYYEKLRKLVGPSNFYPSIIPYKQDKYWSTTVKAVLGDDKIVNIPAMDKIETEQKFKDVQAVELTRRGNKHNLLKSVFINNVKFTVKPEYQQIKSAKLINSFQDMPGGDIQTKANKFIIALANKYGDQDRLLINNYAYYADKEDKIVQDMKLGDEKRIYSPQFMASTADIKEYLATDLGLLDHDINSLVTNSHAWTNNFKDFTLKYEYRLPAVDGDPVELLKKQIDKMGRMKWDNPVYVKQYNEELSLLTNNGVLNLIPYFLPIVGIFDFYQEIGELTGPGRGCLTGDAMVYANNRLTKLSDVKIGDYVYTHDGSKQKVLNRFVYDTKESLLSIKSEYAFNQIKLTHDHKLLGVKREKISNNPKQKTWGDFDPVKDLIWDRADKFKVGDVLFTPWVDRTEKEFEPIDIMPFIRNKIHSYDDNYITIKIPNANEYSIHRVSQKTGISPFYLGRIKNKIMNVEKISKAYKEILSNHLKSIGLTLNDWIEKDNTTHHKLKRYFEFTPQTARMIGRWIGDGWTTNKENKFGIAFNSNETADQQDFKDWLDGMGITYTICKSKNKNLTQIVSNFNFIGNLFVALFPDYQRKSKTKYIGDFIHFKMPLLKELYNGLIGSDGHIYTDKNSGNRVCYDTTSQRLVSDFKLLLNYLKTPSSVKTRPSYMRGKYRCAESYKLCFLNPDFLRRDKEHICTDKGHFSKILEIKEIEGDGKVYDITVEKNHNYLTSNYIVHNSAGGFLISYLLGITHTDPIKHDLSSSRFLTLDRVKQGNLPDIDFDMSTRSPLVGADGSSGYLFNKYGNKAAQVSTRTLLRIKSAILDANRFFNNGVVNQDVTRLSKGLPTTPQGVDDIEYILGYEDDQGVHQEGLLEKSEDLQKYASERPQEWDLVKRTLSLVRQNSRHACSFLIADKPIEDIVPTFEVGGVRRITQPTSKQCEEAGLIKYDFLVVSCLRDLNLCMNYINKKNKNKNMITGHFMHNGEDTYIWDLPQDPAVYQSLADGKTETVFQLNSAGATPTVKKIGPKSINDLATITALERPGPKDFKDPVTGRNMVEEYIERRFGRASGDIEVLNELLPETYGIIIYQEQVTRITKELANMGVEDSENVRIAMGKKKKKLLDSLKPVFIAGAEKKVSRETAEKIWSIMETFSRYSFNRSHSVAYVVISYACAFLKYHYPLEWWASVLSNADQKEINEVLYKYIKDMVLPPDVNTSTEEMVVDYNLNKIRNKLSMISGIGEKAAEKIISKRPYTDITDFARKKVCGESMTKKLIHVGALDSLFTPNESLINKISQYDQAISLIEFEDKLVEYDERMAEFSKNGDTKGVDRTINLKKKAIEKGPKDPLADEFYPSLKFRHKMDYLVKKSIFPTINLDLSAVLKKDSKKPIIKGPKGDMIMDKWGKDVKLLSGEHLQQIDNVNVTQDAKFCVPGYIMKAEEFSYQGGERKALKMIIDSSGYISEKVLWPDYNTGQLNYPSNLKEGCIAYLIYVKKPDKPFTSVNEIIVEENSIKS